MSRRELTFGEKLFLGVMQTMSRLTQGYEVGFAEELIREHGIKGLREWGNKTLGTYNELCAHFGERDAHLLASFASFWNGCDYCAYGHLLAHNLHAFEENGSLFPIYEGELLALMRRRDGENLQMLEAQLGKPEYAKRLALLKRQYALQSGEAQPDPSQPDDAFLVKSIGLYQWVNECSIVVDAPAPPLGTIAKKKALQRTYEQARAAQQATGASQPSTSAPVAQG
ncbi:MAG: hypothetical protein JST54_32310 [Deltaproteobacteria bacterium]|nr:hypothetical protein [Deltaproteobacteria bacterium]